MGKNHGALEGRKIIIVFLVGYTLKSHIQLLSILSKNSDPFSVGYKVLFILDQLGFFSQPSFEAESALGLY